MLVIYFFTGEWTMLNQQYLKAVYMSCRLTGKAHLEQYWKQWQWGDQLLQPMHQAKETVKDGINGYIVKVKSSQALVKAMFSFIEQPELIESMGNNSRKIAEDKYDIDKVNKHMMLEMGFKI